MFVKVKGQINHDEGAVYYKGKITAYLKDIILLKGKIWNI